MQLEKEGYNYYKVLSKKIDDIETEKLLNFLAEEEMNHFNTFSDLASQIKKEDERNNIITFYDGHVESVTHQEALQLNWGVEKSIPSQ